MKRIGNLYSKIISVENLTEADKKAQKGKLKQYGVQIHNKNKESNILNLHYLLKTKTYKTSEYDVFKVYEPKEREVYRLPYFPDRITHHAIMNVLEPIFVSTFTSDTYSCIKNRGIHLLLSKLKRALKNKNETTYCLKLDIKKFYPSINHNVLKELLRRKFKDNDLLWLLDEIIDSANGLPIGNYLSQYFANFYLTYFDHWVKEKLKVKYYFRYADDIVILHNDKNIYTQN
ncbi:reverse transcriptase domain-containing protein [Tenacibaculum maritimum]